jgi:glutathione S-transferase
MYKLYYGAGSCSMAIHIALLECNQQFKLEKVDLMAGQQRSPEFLKINPRGQVPVLVEHDHAIREGAAILIHILEKHQSQLLPRGGKERIAALEWLMFCNATLHPAYARCFFVMRNAEDGAVKDKLLEVAIGRINDLWQEVEQQLAKHPYLCGDQITMADILMTVIANWSTSMPKPVNIGPHTKKLFKNIIARPSYKKAMEVEHVEYKVAA